MGQLSERLGNNQEAIQSFLQAAELYIKNQDAEKALANWVRVTQLDPEHITAHSYLAMVHERLGHTQQAATEYLTVASLLQRTGNNEKAAEMVGRAMRLDPNSPEARQAQTMLKSWAVAAQTDAAPRGTRGPAAHGAGKTTAIPKNCRYRPRPRGGSVQTRSHPAG